MKRASGWPLVGLAAINIVVILVMQIVGRDLNPYTIVEFEFAGTVERAGVMVQFWQSQRVLPSVFFLIGFDYLFMISYSTFLWLSCRKVALQMEKGLRTVLRFIAYAQFLAAILDATENIALYHMAAGSSNPAWPVMAAYCAAPKFTIALIGALVAFFGWGRWFYLKINR